MAEQVQITGTQSEGKIRNPLGVIGLTLITLGIYGLFWYFYINREMAEMGKARNTEELGTSPATSLMAVLFGWIIIVPPFVSTYKTCKRLNNAETAVGRPQGMEAPLLWLIYIFLWPVGAYILQSNLNKVLEAQAGQAPETAAPQIDAPEAAVAPAAPAAVAPADVAPAGPADVAPAAPADVAPAAPADVAPAAPVEAAPAVDTPVSGDPLAPAPADPPAPQVEGLPPLPNE